MLGAGRDSNSDSVCTHMSGMESRPVSNGAEGISVTGATHSMF